MAKGSTAKKSTAVAVKDKGDSNLPAHLRTAKPSGRGTSTDAHDNIIPMGRILQKMSQEVEKKGQQYVQGAEVGDIYFKNLSPPIIKGQEGFLFQPCDYKWGYVEWLPRGKGGGGGAGYVAFYPPDQKPKDTSMKPDPMNKERMIEVRKNGNVIVETRYHSGYIIDPDGENAPIACVLPFSGSGHGVSKAWMGMMNRKVVEGQKADSWWAYYRLKTVSKTKNNNTWDLFEVTDAGPEKNGIPTTMWAPTEEDLQRGEELFLALDSGTKTFDASEAADNTGEEKM
jgi:hypothetical protein